LFTKDATDKAYYYVIAKDYEWSFVALQVKAKGASANLDFERVEKLPKGILTSSNKTSLLDNLMIFKISLRPDTNWISVLEYHKGRMEPYPKTIKVYE
jgi:hypothetical protein